MIVTNIEAKRKIETNEISKQQTIITQAQYVLTSVSGLDVLLTQSHINTEYTTKCRDIDKLTIT